MSKWRKVRIGDFLFERMGYSWAGVMRFFGIINIRMNGIAWWKNLHSKGILLIVC